MHVFPGLCVTTIHTVRWDRISHLVVLMCIRSFYLCLSNYLIIHFSTVINRTKMSPESQMYNFLQQWRHQNFHPGGGTTNMFTEAGIHHRNVYIKKYDKLAHLITRKMAWSFQRQASVILSPPKRSITLESGRRPNPNIMHVETAKFFYMPELRGGGTCPSAP